MKVFIPMRWNAETIAEFARINPELMEIADFWPESIENWTPVHIRNFVFYRDLAKAHGRHS